MALQSMSYRQATRDDVPGIFVVRTSVQENLLTSQEMAAYGITPASVADSFSGPCCGWVAIVGEKLVGFSIANKETGSIFALFVLPSHQGLGLGRHLLGLATDWLWSTGAQTIWLRTQLGASAAAFYAKAGWRSLGVDGSGQLRFELTR